MATGNYSLQLPADGAAPVDGQAVVAPQGYQQYTTGGTRSRKSVLARKFAFVSPVSSPASIPRPLQVSTTTTTAALAGSRTWATSSPVSCNVFYAPYLPNAIPKGLPATAPVPAHQRVLLCHANYRTTT